MKKLRNRITSYNVCYTKLLRDSNENISEIKTEDEPEKDTKEEESAPKSAAELILEIV